MKNTFKTLAFGLAFGLTLPVANLDVHAINAESSKLSAGFHHSSAYKYDGSVWSWGHNYYGQLGLGNKKHKNLREQNTIEGAIHTATGKYHTLVVKEDGTVWSYGQNTYGKLGDGTGVIRISPVQVAGLSDVKAVSAGDQFSLALKNDGTVYAWGMGNVLGNGTKLSSKVPVKVAGLSDVVAISSGSTHSLALTSNGDVYAWGYNSFGQLGNGLKTTSLVPVKINSLSNVKAISAGFNHSLAVKENGTVAAWGQNTYGKLGDGTATTRLLPVQVKGLTDVKDVSAGMYHSAAVKENGTVFAWGHNAYGQLGDGTKITRSTPAQVKELSDIRSVATGAYHSLAVKEDGTVYSWGQNSYGKLGDGTIFARTIPVIVRGLDLLNENPDIGDLVPDPIDEEEILPPEDEEEEVIEEDNAPPSTDSNVPDEWVAEDQFNVVLSAKDNETEVESTFYSVNGSTQKQGDNFLVDEKGKNKITFYSVDKAGNKEAPKTVELKIDANAPTTTSNVESGFYNNQVNVSLTATDAESGVEKTVYSINGSTAIQGTDFTLIGEGTHHVTYYSVDYSGNKEEEKSFTVTIDYTAPETNANVTDGLYNKEVQVLLTASDKHSGISRTFYSVDGSEATEGTDFVVTGEGLHHIVFYSVDRAGNKEEAKFLTLTIDETKPTTVSSVEEGWSKGDVLVQLSAFDSLSGVAGTYYSVNSAPFQKGNSFLINSEGIHSVSFYSVDEAGNVEAVKHVLVKIDKSLPTILFDLEKEYALGSKATLRFDAQDAVSGIQHQVMTVNGQEVANGSVFTFDKTGVYKIKIVTRDNAGWTTIVEKEVVVYVPAKVTVTPGVLQMNKGKFLVKVDLPKEFTNSFQLTSVSLDGKQAINESKGDLQKATNGMFMFERSDFDWTKGSITVEFRGVLATGEAVVGLTTVQVK